MNDSAKKYVLVNGGEEIGYEADSDIKNVFFENITINDCEMADTEPCELFDHITAEPTAARDKYAALFELFHIRF